MSGEGGSVDLNSLTTPQLVDVKQHLEQEVQHLSDSFQKLVQAQQKFQECSETVRKTSKEENEGKPMLVPLTSSLYVPGKVKDHDTFLVDVGTGYYVEKVFTLSHMISMLGLIKNSVDTIKFYDNKVATLKRNLVDLETVVNGKMSNLRVVEDGK